MPTPHKTDLSGLTIALHGYIFHTFIHLRMLMYNVIVLKQVIQKITWQNSSSNMIPEPNQLVPTSISRILFKPSLVAMNPTKKTPYI